MQIKTHLQRQELEDEHDDENLNDISGLTDFSQEGLIFNINLPCVILIHLINLDCVADEARTDCEDVDSCESTSRHVSVSKRKSDDLGDLNVISVHGNEGFGKKARVNDFAAALINPGKCIHYSVET